MARRKVIPDELIVAAVIKHGTIIGAAKQLGMSARTVYSRMHEPKTRLLYESLRADVLRASIADWESEQDSVLQTLLDIANDITVQPGVRMQSGQYFLADLRAMKQDLRKAEDKITELCREANVNAFAEEFITRHKDILERIEQ